MASERRRGRKQLLLTLAALTAIPAQAQTAPAIIGGSGSQGSWTMPADDRDTRPYTGPVDTHEAAPQITITANRDTIFGSLEDLHLTVKRDAAGNRLVVTVKLEQDRQWLADRSHEVTIHAGDTIADLTIPRDDFNPNVTSSGELTATVDDISGYGTANAKATVFVISQEEPVVTYSLSHDGDAIGSGTIHIVDRFPGPRVAITFEGVRPPRDAYTAGVATGPFTARITFSERVEGFTREDIEWATHSETTVDSTNIGVFMWDYTEVRAGLEYTARMMPEQSGRLWIEVSPGAATSVATGDGNQLGANSVWVELPDGRMMVAPAELSVDEGDAEGAGFMVVLTSKPTGTVTVTLSGTEGTALETTSVVGLTFKGPFWTVGRVVRVTAGDDANAADETVTLRLDASGGGYDGKSANVVVTVRDDDSASGDVDDEAAALILLEGVTPEAAAAALFGEQKLSEARLDALDRLGNGNGRYDLGDLLSWIERCRQGATSRGAVSVGLVAGAVAVLPAGGPGGRSGGTSRRSRGSGGSAARRRTRVRRIRRRPGRSWYGLALMLVASLTWACADDVVQPSVAEPDPGFLTVQLTAPPAARDLGALLVVEGPGIESVRSPGFELFRSETISPRQIVVAGALSTGPIVQFQVPDRGLHRLYRVRLLQVTGEDHSLRDLSAYRAEILR